jgi:hypothetical protein
MLQAFKTEATLRMSQSTLVRLFILFMFIPIVGTISHELGHVWMAKILGYHTQLHYGSMDWHNETYTDLTAPAMHRFLVAIAGPVITWLIALVGFLLVRRTANPIQKWLGLSLAFFAFRNTANLIMLIIHKITGLGHGIAGGDEYRLSVMMGMPYAMLDVVMGMIGYFVCFGLYDQFIPKPDRKLFKRVFIGGCVAGVALWFYLLGPLLLP